ncbi:MAG: hypothetical protein GY756_25370 [bacterium]|nr:hypothetical protein [bacterium]
MVKEKALISIFILLLLTFTAATGTSAVQNKLNPYNKIKKNDTSLSDSYYLLNNIMNDYNKNITKAGKKWKNKEISLTLKFTDVNKIYNKFMVFCTSGKTLRSDDYAINFTVSHDEYEKLKKLDNGRTIKIKGRLNPMIDTFDSEISLNYVKIITA